MNRPENPDHDPYILLGYAQKCHGLKGEIYVNSALGELADVFDETAGTIQGRFDDGRTLELRLRTVRIHKDKLLVAFEDYPDRTAAEKLSGIGLWIQRDQVNLPESVAIKAELPGCEVVTGDGTLVGRVEDVWELPANDVLQVMNGEKEVLVPLVPEFVTDIDLERSIITIDAIEGLLD